MDALERILRGAYEVGALGVSDGAVQFYQGRGWKQWQGSTSVLGVGPACDPPGLVGGVSGIDHRVQLRQGAHLVRRW
ncbi:MAG: hypothetical protein ACJ72W_03600 [Actinoallomurus sp.]